MERNNESALSFYKLDGSINDYPKLYYIEDKMNVFTYMDTSGYAIGDYLYFYVLWE